MGFVIRRDRPALLPRAAVAPLLERSEAVAWLLVAGPGSGKTCLAFQLADRLNLLQVAFEAQADPSRDDLAAMVGARAKATGPELARRLEDYLGRNYPGGCTIVFDAVERLLGDARAMAFLEAWLQEAAKPWFTLIASRQPLPFSLARRAAEGAIVQLGRADLWLTEGEVAAWSAGRPLDLGLVDEVAGWPLGLKALLHSPTTAGSAIDPAKAMLRELAESELLWALPSDLQAIAVQLGICPVFDPNVLQATFRVQDLSAACQRLAQWGVLLGSEGERRWHPLVREGARKAWLAQVPQNERPERIQALMATLAESCPFGALTLAVEQEAWDAALAALAKLRGKLVKDGDFTQLLAWLTRFPQTYQHEDGLLNLMLGKKLIRDDGEFAEPRGRFERAAEIFRKSGDLAGEFEALSALLVVCIDSNDRARVRDLVDRLDHLQEHVPREQQLRYQSHLGCLYWLEEDFDRARQHFRAVLDQPHFDDAALIVLHQLAAMNLGAIEDECGDLLLARRLLLRAKKLADAYPFRAVVGCEVALRLSLIGVRSGDPGAAGMALPSDLGVNVGPGQEYLLMLEGDLLLSLDRERQAAERFERALSELVSEGHELPLVAGYAQSQLAVIERRAGCFGQALRLHESAFAATRTHSREAAKALTEWGITHVLAGQVDAGLAKLGEAIARLDGLAAPQHLLAALLGRAVAAGRLGDHAGAGATIVSALAILRQGVHEHVLLRELALAPELWALLSQHGGQDVLERAEARFGQKAKAVREGLKKEVLLSVLPVMAPERIAIRCFGKLEVQVGTRTVASWPRKKARAMLAHLLLAAEGLSADELSERLFPDQDPVAGSAWLGKLSSSLRR
ncbi:MAG: hypothetical protein KGR26_05605, partial [Cyanobacteria bacterium REEB65]|nr:hypothetical protein [Cyanobacteria bacterium REEB65]